MAKRIRIMTHTTRGVIHGITQPHRKLADMTFVKIPPCLEKA